MFRKDNLMIMLRLAAFILYGYSVLYRHRNETLPINQRKQPFGKWKYLTYLNLLLQFGFFLLAFISSFRMTPKPLKRLTNFLYYSLAFPFAMFVTISFWIIWFIDRELVFPKAYDEFYPFWLHQTSHTLVGIMVCAELFLAERAPPSKHQQGLIFINLFSYFYALWVLYIAITTDVWVYPILRKLNWPARIGFGLSLGFINSIFYELAIYLNQRVFQSSSKKLTNTGSSRKQMKTKAN